MLRAITVFTAPAGTTNSSGRWLARPGLWPFAKFRPELEHWGIIVQTKAEFEAHEGYCVELDRAEDRVIAKVTQWQNRRVEDGADERWFKFGNRVEFTDWTDEEITREGMSSLAGLWKGSMITDLPEAERICLEQLRGTYALREGNCQVLVNILWNVIMLSDGVYLPWTILGDHFRGGTPILDTQRHIYKDLMRQPLEIRSSQAVPDWTIGELQLEEFGNSCHHTFESLTKLERPGTDGSWRFV